jgi:hypothetical protein
MPISLLWFALAAAFFVIQGTSVGLLFIFFGGGLLLPVPINAGFISLALESAFGRVSRWWLLVPALWFGGYAALALMSQMAFDKLLTETAQHNTDTRLTFSPESDLLLIDDSSGALGNVANGLVEFYDLPVAYESGRASSKTATRAFRVGGKDVCPRVFNDAKFVGTGISAQGVKQYPELRDYSAPAGFKYEKNLCILRAPEHPATATYTVTAKRENINGFLLSYWLDQIEVAAPDGRTIQLSSGLGAPYKWWPAITILPGCGGSTHCRVGFLRQTERWIGGTDLGGLIHVGSLPVIAQALGLEFSPASLRRETLENAAIPESIRAPNWLVMPRR